MKTLLLVLSVLFFSHSLSAQSWTWHWGSNIGSGIEDEDPKVATDGNDNVIVAGLYLSEITVGDDTWPTPYNTDRHIIIVKYDADGNILWSSSIGGDLDGPQSSSHVVYDIATDADGNVYLAGFLGNNATMCGVEIGNTHKGSFLAKINSDGTYAWNVLTAEQYLNDMMQALHVDAAGNSYVGVKGDVSLAYDFGGVTPSGEDDAIDPRAAIFKVDPDGNTLWGLLLDTTRPLHIATDSEGDILVSTYHNQGGPDEAGHYLVKVDGENQEILWTRYAFSNATGTSHTDLGLYVKSDNSIIQYFNIGSGGLIDFGNGFVTGGGPGNYLGYLLHIDADGSTLSMEAMVDNFQEENNTLSFNSFAAIDDENFYLVGDLNGETVLSDGTAIVASPNIFGIAGKNVLVFKVDEELNITGIATQTGSSNHEAFDVAVLSNGDAMVAGLFETTTHPFFGEGTFLIPDNVISNGDDDIFITRVTTGELEGNSVSESAEFEYQLYPNPAQENTRISSASSINRLEVLDLTGKLINSISIKDALSYDLNLNTFSNGIYFIKVYSGAGVSTRKLIVRH